MNPFGGIEELLLRWAVVALVGIALAVTGFVKGMEWQQGRDVVKEEKITIQKEQVRHEVEVGQNKIAAAFVQGQMSRDAEFKQKDDELAKTRKERDEKPSSCDVSEHDLGVLNSSRIPGRPASDRPVSAGGVQGTGSPEGRATEHPSGDASTGLQGPVAVPRSP